MAAFWHPEICAFLLPTAPIGPTLMDVAMIVHLPIVGEDPIMGTLDGQEPRADHPGLSRVSTRLTETDGKKLDTAASGPFWFLELWFRLYFPDVFQLGHPPIAPTSEKSLGIALNRLCLGRNNLQASDPIIIAILADNRNNTHFYIHRRYIGYASGLFWPFLVSSPLSEPDPLPHPTYSSSWDAALKAFYTVNYQPQFLARQFGCQQGLPGPIAHPHLVIQSPYGKVIPDLIDPYISQLTNYITSNSYIPFKTSPASIETFREWWLVIWALITLDKDRLLGILLPQLAVVLGATPLTNTRRKLIVQGTGSGTPQRKKKALQTQVVPLSGGHQPTLTDCPSGRAPVKTRPRPGPTSARASAQTIPIPNKSIKPPTDQLHELEPPTKRWTPVRASSPAEPATTRVSSRSEATASEMGRLPYVASDPSLPNMAPIATLASTSTVIASDVVASKYKDISDAALQIDPDEPAAAAPDAPDQGAANERAAILGVADLGADLGVADLGAVNPRAADPLPEADRLEGEPVPAQPRGLLQELQEIPSSDSKTSVNLGPRSIPQRPLEAADESAIVVPAAQPSRHMAILAPSVTTIRPEQLSDSGDAAIQNLHTFFRAMHKKISEADIEEEIEANYRGSDGCSA
ncbi:uncharacterized protein LOC127247147 [Andrographis paniculata]|uniref:uncharacterized protein LOC127247147 n=1 Tax=Andrographis paniculata TaxID=175694 RepID=UPI0021E8E534|nr:uncharacterized protein LOC127247147 [Andrographis paniculata]